MVGQWANLKPDDPKVFVESVGAILSTYPLRIVEECCDPRTGLSRQVEFFSLKSLTDWLDARLDHYQKLSKWRPLPAERQIESGPITAQQIGNLMAELAAALRANASLSPLDTLLRKANHDRRLRLSEIARVAAEEPADDLRAIYAQTEAA